MDSFRNLLFHRSVEKCDQLSSKRERESAIETYGGIDI
jgi:hypothetical protein